jgi:Flp pilus assembly protein TadG
MPADTIGFDNRARRRLRDRRSRPGWPIIPHRCGAESIDHLFAANDEDELTRPRRTAILIRAVYGLWIWPLRLARDTRGVVLVLVALLLPVLVGLTGFGVETGLWYAIKRQNQAAADEAALSGAMEVAAAKPDVTAQALCMARWNGFDSSVAFPPCPNALNGATVNNPPTSGTYSGNNSYVEVILSQQQSTLFANFNPINLANITIKTRAVAGPTSSNPACVLALATSGTDVTLAGSPVTVNTGACSVDTNSNSATSVVFNGHPHLTSYTIVTSGNYSVGGATVTLTTPATTNAPATTDPYANAAHVMPSLASCLPNTSAPTPGNCYNGITINGSYNFSAGVYYVAGNGALNSNPFAISGNGNVTGNGVTIVLFNGSDVSITGGVNVTLTAPNAGIWQGILFWQDKASTTPCTPLVGCTSDTISGGAATDLTGALYFPHGNVDFGGNNTSNCTVLIANTVTFHGTPAMSAAGCAAAGVTPPTNGSGAIALVE